MIWVKQNDTRPPASTVLSRGTTIVNLTTATSVTFKMRMNNSVGVLKVDSAAVVLDAIAGSVEYQWSVGDTDTKGTFAAEWEVLWNDGTKETFPTITADFVRIQADLDGGI
jgi:hypothetical protein